MALWVAAAVGLALTAPNMAELVREKGQINVPDGYSSSFASDLQASMSAGEEDSGEATVLVFHNEQGLTEADQAEIKHAVEELKQAGSASGITSVTSHIDNAELKDQMVSADGTTVLVLTTVALGERTPEEAGEAIYAAVEDVKVEHYFTGNWLISEDVNKSSEEGLKKTEMITVVFIVGILLLVFRSVVAPFIPLLTVGFSYLVSQSVVSFLVKYWDFPLSSFTQIFMVAVLFGIGTDYCILLISRYKEELMHTKDRTEAIVATYRTAGKTVIYSGLAVLVGFASIGLSTFVLYRSAVAVAVGVAVMLIALITIVPFFMSVLGKAIFWPAKGSLEHKPSRLWGAVGRFSLKRPAWAIVILAVLVIPFLAAYKGSISFNSLDEIGDKYDSVKGFNVISASFGPGDSLPSTVVMKSEQPMDNSEGLAAIEQISRELAKVDGVKSVRSATRPTGEALADLQVTDQVTQLGDGLVQSEDGLDQIGSGLAEASSSLSANAPKLEQAVSGVGELIDGTNELKNGVTQLGAGLKQLQQGLESGESGAAELSAGLKQAKASADQLHAASEKLVASYTQLGTGLDQLSAGYSSLSKQQTAITQGLTGLDQSLSSLATKYPELAADPDFVRTQTSARELQSGSEQIGGGLAQLNSQLADAASGMKQANAGFQQAADGQAALTQGLAKLSAGLEQLKNGIAQAANGQGQIVSKLPALTGGFDQLTAGQQELKTGFAELSGQLGQLTDGLDQSVDGLNQVSTGLATAGDYLNGLASAPDKQLTGWYIPQEAIDGEDFQQALDAYLSPDRKTVTFDVVFDGNPYAVDTLVKVDELETAVARALKNTDFQQAEYAVGGVSSINNDLRNISAEDYSRTMILMLIGIGLILIIMFRSIVMPLYLLLSLLLTFYTSMAITEVIFVRILGLSGISWAVPFFGFVMLMALGIDYSIFLMDRFKEYRHLSPREAILRSMENMGTVIMSAALILGGTFAAMLPSGVMSLLQIGTIVLCGLFLYAMVMLPLFIPVMVRMFGEANWWPFMSRQANDDVSFGGAPVSIHSKE